MLERASCGPRRVTQEAALRQESGLAPCVQLANLDAVKGPALADLIPGFDAACLAVLWVPRSR